MTTDTLHYADLRCLYQLYLKRKKDTPRRPFSTHKPYAYPSTSSYPYKTLLAEQNNHTLPWVAKTKQAH